MCCQSKPVGVKKKKDVLKNCHRNFLMQCLFSNSQQLANSPFIPVSNMTWGLVYHPCICIVLCRSLHVSTHRMWFIKFLCMRMHVYLEPLLTVFMQKLLVVEVCLKKKKPWGFEVLVNHVSITDRVIADYGAHNKVQTGDQMICKLYNHIKYISKDWLR